ncbi:MAG: hypothetical protein LBU70_06185 [Chitinispirillales bacterium]|jgi:hypothetical protein|nr:hypothetical protein [Chitinispirillales bacterium]
MPTYDEHMDRISHNNRLLLFLEQSEKHAEFSDWYVTIAFYIASNHAEAMFFAVKPEIHKRMGVVTRIEHSRSHRERNRILKHFFKDVFKVYTTLYGYSRIAKYRQYVPISPNSQDAKSLLADIGLKCEKLIKGQNQQTN